MGLDAMHVRLYARDLGLQGLNPLLQLLDRYRVEILLGKLDQRIARLAWEEVIQVHSGIV